MIRAVMLPVCRMNMFLNFMDSLHVLPADWRVYVVFQAFSDDEMTALKAHPNWERITDFLRYPDRRPPYPTRDEILRKWGKEIDIWCQMDDDMQFIPNMLNYDTPSLKVIEASVGVVSCNWIKHENFLKKRGISDEWIKQPLVNMAGGLLYSRKIADLLMSEKVAPYLFCDIQVGLLTYTHGYDNYRYLGSMIIHRIGAKDGLVAMHKWLTMERPDPKLLTIKPSNTPWEGENAFLMPDSSCLTTFAHMLHRGNQKQALQTGRLYEHLLRSRLK